MSTSPERTAPRWQPHWPPKAALVLGCGIAALAAAGFLGIYREIALLWICWTTDPLRSIGMLIPPASIVLTLRVWRRAGWEMRGTWWGLLVIALSFFLSILRQNVALIGIFGLAMFSFIPVSLPVYVYGSGVVLLFAGARVWRKAWFPLGLLLLSQPVPSMLNRLVDIPLQNLSARVARSFAALIHFAPTTPQLRLMFSPDFGMFIAPGCDGIRGAVAMGYVALILGYLKRVSWSRWLAYVTGAVLLGYFFNFVRLCVLVLYYRIALGHPALEGVAKQADYVIGSCLFLVAVFLFLHLARRRNEKLAPADIAPILENSMPHMQTSWMKCAAFAITLLVVLSLPSSALRYSRKNPVTPASLASRMPKQIGAFGLTRTWYEQQDGTIVLEGGAYSAPGSDEIVLGVWVAPLLHFHDPNLCWLARGLQPDILTSRPFVTAHGKSVELSTGFYSDGITDSIVVNAVCTPGSCLQLQRYTSSERMGLLILHPQIRELADTGAHPVSIMLRIDRLRSDTPTTVTYDLLTTEARNFLSGLDPPSLSRAFQ